MAGRVASIKRLSAAGADNGIATVSSTVGKKYRFLFATAVYSASPTQAGVTLTLDSGAGSAYDAVLLSGSANATTTILQPTNEIIINSDDVLTLTAPAGGSGKTSGIAMYLEEIA